VSDDRIEDYLREVEAFPELSGEKQDALADIVAVGRLARERLIKDPKPSDKEMLELLQEERDAESAKTELVRGSLHTVVTIAKLYDVGDVPLADLIQEGTSGLEEAVDTYDPDSGLSFSSHAAPTIRKAIQRGLESRTSS